MEQDLGSSANMNLDGGALSNGYGMRGQQASFKEGPGVSEAGEAGAGKPGSGWKTKRVQEEYQRAIDGVVDRDFSLKEFGDIFSPTEQS